MKRTIEAFLVLLSFTVGCGGAPARIEGTEPGDCSDGADNDADGTFDCRDLGCAGAPSCETADAGGRADAAVDAGGIPSGCMDVTGTYATVPVVIADCEPFGFGSGVVLELDQVGCNAQLVMRNSEGMGSDPVTARIVNTGVDTASSDTVTPAGSMLHLEFMRIGSAIVVDGTFSRSDRPADCRVTSRAP